MKAQSYRFFVEHAYNHIFQHEAFHQSARARTKAKDLGAGDFHTSTKLDGYVWLANTDKMVHMPKDQADDVNMGDDDDDVHEEVELLPTLQGIVRLQEGSKKEEDVSSPQREETSQQAGHSEEIETPELDISRVNRPENRYGHYIIRQLKPEHQELLRDMAFNSQNVLTQADMEGRSPLHRDEIGYSSMVFMMEYLARESHKNFMEIFAPSTRTDISDEEYHEFRLELKRVVEDNKNVNQDNFEDAEEPFIPLQRREDQDRVEPEFQGTVESLSRENRHIYLETEDDALIEWWLSMYDKTVRQKIMESVVKQETKEEEEEEEEVEVEEEQEEPQEPTVPPPTLVSMECQTDDSFLSEPKAGSSSQKEEPVPPEGSAQTEVSREKQADIQKGDTAPKPETAKSLLYGDITGNEDDSVFRKLSKCFF